MSLGEGMFTLEFVHNILVKIIEESLLSVKSDCSIVLKHLTEIWLLLGESSLDVDVVVSKINDESESEPSVMG